MKPVAEWAYKGQNGTVVGYVRRFDKNNITSTGKASKQIVPYFIKGETGFKSGIPDKIKNNRPLFGTEALQSDSEPVHIVEGEKCASALIGLGFQAVTALGGSQAANLTAWEELKGYQKLVIIPDNDKAGYLFAEAAYKRIKSQLGNLVSIYICNLPNLPIGGDIIDYIYKQPDFEDWDGYSSLATHPYRQIAINKISRAIDTYSQPAPPDWDFVSSSTGLTAIPYSALNRIELPKREMLLSPWLAQRSINMVFADRGIGKTYFCLSCAIALALGKPFIHYSTIQPVKVLYLDGEMQASILRDRLRALMGTAIPDNLYIVTPDCQTDRDMPNMAARTGLEEIDELILSIDPDVIFVDNLSTFIRSGHENEGETWLPVQDWAIRQRSSGRAVVFIHHTNKEGNQRGSSRKEDVMDIVMQLKRPNDYVKEQDGARFEIHFTKHRNLYGDDIHPIEASLASDETNHLKWSWKKSGGEYEQAIELLRSGLKQKEVCDELGISKSTMSRWSIKAKAEGQL